MQNNTKKRDLFNSYFKSARGAYYAEYGNSLKCVTCWFYRVCLPLVPAGLSQSLCISPGLRHRIPMCSSHFYVDWAWSRRSQTWIWNRLHTFCERPRKRPQWQPPTSKPFWWCRSGRRKKWTSIFFPLEPMKKKLKKGKRGRERYIARARRNGQQATG